MPNARLGKAQLASATDPAPTPTPAAAPSRFVTHVLMVAGSEAPHQNGDSGNGSGSYSRIVVA